MHFEQNTFPSGDTPYDATVDLPPGPRQTHRATVLIASGSRTIQPAPERKLATYWFRPRSAGLSLIAKVPIPQGFPVSTSMHFASLGRLEYA